MTEKYDIKINAYISGEDRRAIRAAAYTQGCSMSEIIRSATLETILKIEKGVAQIEKFQNNTNKDEMFYKISVRFSKEQEKKLCEVTEAANCSTAEFIRYAIYETLNKKNNNVKINIEISNKLYNTITQFIEKGYFPSNMSVEEIVQDFANKNLLPQLNEQLLERINDTIRISKSGEYLLKFKNRN
ncbi:MAG: hypothetical protein QXQ79_01850 [Candidatus Nanoarchaeia archaeon]